MNGVSTFHHRSRNGIRAWFLILLLTSLVQCTQPADQVGSRLPAAAAQSSVPTGEGVARTPDQPWIAIARQAKASVVNISSVRKTKSAAERLPRSFFDDPLFRRFFGEEFERRLPTPPERREQGLGSGVIVSADGYIVTNNHVVEESDDIRVSLPDKRTFKAKVVGTDPKTDLAVIKIDATDLPVLAWGNSAQLQVGEMVLAVGNPFGLNQTVTMGIISATGRANMGIVDYEDFIQTDAAINPGNSGGALVNMQGQLIGINTAIFSQSGGNMGIGFAIPSNMARSVMNSLVKHGKVVRGWLGVSIQEVSPDLAKEFGVSNASGALVADVLDDSPASKARLDRGDIITAVNGTVIRDPVQLRSLVADTIPGTEVTVSLVRDKKPMDVKITVGELPKEVAQAGRRESGSGTGSHALAGVTVEDAASHAERERRSHKRTGVVVTDIEPDSPAERAGLRVGDVIREINRKPIKSIGDFERMTRELSPKSAILVLLSRGNATIFLSIQPGT